MSCPTPFFELRVGFFYGEPYHSSVAVCHIADVDDEFDASGLSDRESNVRLILFLELFENSFVTFLTSRPSMALAWEALRKDARRLETEIDAKLVTYSKLGASLSTTSSRTTALEVSRSANGTEGEWIWGHVLQVFPLANLSLSR